MKSVKGIFVVGERNIFGELSQIIAIASKANPIVISMFKMDYKGEKVTEAVHEIKLLEKESDEIAFRISESITSGAISPNVIDDLLECVKVADNIVDLYYYLSREIVRMAKVYLAGFETKHSDWDTVYENILALAEKSLLKLKSSALRIKCNGDFGVAQRN